MPKVDLLLNFSCASAGWISWTPPKQTIFAFPFSHWRWAMRARYNVWCIIVGSNSICRLGCFPISEFCFWFNIIIWDILMMVSFINWRFFKIYPSPISNTCDNQNEDKISIFFWLTPMIMISALTRTNITIMPTTLVQTSAMR